VPGRADQVAEQGVHPPVARQFRVERRGEHRALPHGHGPAGGRARAGARRGAGRHRGEHLDVGAGGLDPRRADEHRVHRAAGHARHGQVGLEGVDLAAEGVAAHHDVEPAELLLVGAAVAHLAGEQDQARARPVDGQAGRDPGAQRVEQVEHPEQPAHRRRLPAGQHEPVDGGQLGRAAHRHGPDAALLERGEVLADVALQGQHADHGFHVDPG
jgi:hypothetical protein